MRHNYTSLTFLSISVRQGYKGEFELKVYNWGIM